MRKMEPTAVNPGAGLTAVERVCARILGGVLLGAAVVLFALAAAG